MLIYLFTIFLQGDGVVVGLSVSDTGCGGQGDKGLFTQLSGHCERLV